MAVDELVLVNSTPDYIELQIHPSRVDSLNSEAVFQLVQNILLENKQKEVIVNLKSVTYFNSEALGRLITVQKELTLEERETKICCLASDLNQLMRITSLDRFFNLYPTLEAAIQKS